MASLFYPMKQIFFAQNHQLLRHRKWTESGRSNISDATAPNKD